MPLRENLLTQTFLIAIELDFDHEHTTPELTHVDLTGLDPQLERTVTRGRKPQNCPSCR